MPAIRTVVLICFGLIIGVALTSEIDALFSDARSVEQLTGLGPLTIPNNAIKPSCVTSLIPVSSSCHVSVHTLAFGNDVKRRYPVATISRPSVDNKAISPGCSTLYSTSTSCYAGVHPQPTFSQTSIVVTETIQSSSGASAISFTIAVVAEMSVSAPSASASGDAGDYVFYITPQLREDIINIADSFCAGAKGKRQPIGPTCQLEQSAQEDFVSEVTRLIGNGVEIPLRRITAQAATYALGIYAFSMFATGASLPLDIKIKQNMVNNGVSAEESGTSFQLYPTLYPGPPNNKYLAPGTRAVAGLTQYWSDYFSSSWPWSKVTFTMQPTSLPCLHGADPGVYPGTAGYCQCTDGNIYPISPSQAMTDVDGTASTYVVDCPYTTIPSSTMDLGTTIKATPATTTSPLALGSATCFSGASFIGTDMVKQITSFCNTASKDGFAFTIQPGATSTPTGNPFFDGQFQLQNTDVPSEPSGTALYIQAKFDRAACAVGEPMIVDFKFSEWCIDIFESIVSACGPPVPIQSIGSAFSNPGGMMYNSCIEWIITSGGVDDTQGELERLATSANSSMSRNTTVMIQVTGKPAYGVTLIRNHA